MEPAPGSGILRGRPWSKRARGGVGAGPDGAGPKPSLLTRP
jgi:hypothetical protein